MTVCLSAGGVRDSDCALPAADGVPVAGPDPGGRLHRNPIPVPAALAAPLRFEGEARCVLNKWF